MPFVPHELVVANEGYGRTINQFFDIWIKPYFLEQEMQFDRNKFGAAIVEIFDDDKKNKVFLNEQVQVELEFHEPKVKKEDVGKLVNVDLKEIKSLSWSKKLHHEDSAKVLLIRFNEHWWILNFDFRYNQGSAKKKLKRADEFLSAVKTLLRKNEVCHHVLVYLLWSVSELIVEAKLLLSASRTKNDHDARKKKVVQLNDTSNLFSPEFYSLFLLLHKRRNGARYGEKDFSRKFPIEALRKHFRTLRQERHSIGLN